MADGGVVDLAIVLAIDVSASVDLDEFALMIEGLAEAVTDASVLGALSSGPRGSAALAALFWSEPTGQLVAAPWTRVADAGGAGAFAELVRGAARPAQPGRTALGAGVLSAASLLGRNPFPAARQVIDVSGDGASNAGPALAPARRLVLDLGITINGLAVENEEPDLAQWYAAHLIGGAGAFAMPCPDYAAFAEAMKRKLLREAQGPVVA
jgi:hypothetical protein